MPEPCGGMMALLGGNFIGEMSDWDGLLMSGNKFKLKLGMCGVMETDEECWDI
jgi:hypothetical protein